MAEEIVSGRPIPISELPSRKRIGDEWLKITNRLCKGYALLVNRSYVTTRNAIRQLEECGKLNSGEFDAIVRERAGHQAVFLVHNDEVKPRKRHQRRHKIDPENVASYIQGKRGFEHTLAEIQQEFFGRIGSPRTDPEIYYPALHAAVRAREIIQNRKDGKFSSVRRADGTKLYTLGESKL